MISPISAVPAFTHATPEVARPEPVQSTGNTINIVQANNYNITAGVGTAYIANEIAVDIEGDDNIINIIQQNTYNINQGGGVIPYLEDTGLIPNLFQKYLDELLQKLVDGAQPDNGQLVDMAA